MGYWHYCRSSKIHLTVQARYKTDQVLNDKDYGVAQWVFDLGQTAGRGTDTLPFSTALYVPLIASQGPIGVLQVQPVESRNFTPEEIHLIEACANQIALAIEVSAKTSRKNKEIKS